MTNIYLPTQENITLCAEIIKKGGLVAFPTETVYGLGADGMNETAVKNIFFAKGRASDNPLILHVADIALAETLYVDIPERFYDLAQAFWPAPLTIICKKSKLVNDAVSAGLNTVAVRMPLNDCALELIRMADAPIAAPSANLSGRPSPTEAMHVFNDLNNRIAAILDGGVCKYGLESTVISLVEDPVILRPGCITPKMLERVLGKVKVADSILRPLNEGEKPLSPGMKHTHYTPNAKVIAFSGEDNEIAEKINREYQKQAGKKCIILASEELAPCYDGKEYEIIGRRSDKTSFCASLFGEFRKYNDYDFIFCEALSLEDEGIAYMNRLLRACGFDIR